MDDRGNPEDYWVVIYRRRWEKSDKSAEAALSLSPPTLYTREAAEEYCRGDYGREWIAVHLREKPGMAIDVDGGEFPLVLVEAGAGCAALDAIRAEIAAEHRYADRLATENTATDPYSHDAAEERGVVKGFAAALVIVDRHIGAAGSEKDGDT
jgi:hypothetical protein